MDAKSEIESLRKKLVDKSFEHQRLLACLQSVRESLQFANDTPNGGINDTIWMMHRNETLFDFIDSELDQHRRRLTLIGESRPGGVVWFGVNPHGHPAGTRFYAEASQRSSQGVIG